MLRLVFICFCLLFISLASSSVQAALDNMPVSVAQLKANINELSDSNIKKLSLYTDLVKQIRRSDPDQALQYGKEGLALHHRH